MQIVFKDELSVIFLYGNYVENMHLPNGHVLIKSSYMEF